jgi:hypothetical protein
VLPLTVEEGARLIISGGSVMTDHQAAALQASVTRLSAPASASREESP